MNTKHNRKWNKLLVVMIVLAIQLMAMPQLVSAGNTSIDFSQLETKPAANWVNGNLNSSNSSYTEGMSTPQRVILEGLDASQATHSVTLSYQFTKAGHYAYDFLTSWSQAVDAASEISGATWSDSWKWLGTNATLWPYHTTAIVPNDNFSGTSRQTTYESEFGNRYIDLYANGTISNAQITIANSLDGAVTGDSTVIWTVTWEGTATNVMILYAGHIAVGLDFPATGLGWGSGMGAGGISGSPYHHTLVSGSDWTGGSSMDNQMQAGSIALKTGIAGLKWHDINGDGSRDANGVDNILGNADDEVGLAGWEIWVDIDGDGIKDTGDTSTLTGADGTYTLLFTLPSQSTTTVRVREVMKSGWMQTFPAAPGYHSLSVVPAVAYPNINFGNKTMPPQIEVTKVANPTSVPETGGNVTFTYTVKNTGGVPVTITSLSDSVFGTLAGDTDSHVGTALAVGASTSFTLVKWVEGDFSGPDHVNVFTAHAEDSVGTDASDSDDATVDFTNVLPTIEVTKTADPTEVFETGGWVKFTFVVKNTSSEEPVTITSLTDSVFGILEGDADMMVGTVLAAGASASFEITRWVEGDFSGPDHRNIFTAVAKDNDNTTATDDDDAIVDFTNVAPTILVTKTPSVASVPETGADVVFTFTVKNTSTEEPVTITSLSDSVYGTLAGDADLMVGTVLAAGEERSFQITRWVEGDFSGPDHRNIFTAVAKDNDNTTATDDDDAIVDFTNVAPTILVTKTPSVASVPETGADVVFTFTVKNTSTEESVTITSLSDSVYGTLAGDADLMVGTVLAAGEERSFQITRWVEGDFSGPDHVNTFTAVAKDNDNTTATDDDDATVDFTDVPPTILVTKTPSVTSVPETGADVVFTFTVKNTSTEEPVTILSLVDSVFGTLVGDADLMVGTVLAAGEERSFQIIRWVEGNFSGPDHVNTFTAVAEDNDGTDATDDDDATVDFTDVPPTILVTKTPSVTSVPETGADVVFTFTVKNTSTEEPVTILSLSDSVFGTLAGDADLMVGTVLAAGEERSFQITRWVEGDFSGLDHQNTFTAVAEDNDGTDATDSDDAIVDFTDVAISILVTKTPNLTEVPETGADVVFTFTVKNTSSEESVTITSLVDSVFGTLVGDADLMVGTVLAAGEEKSFQITRWIEGNYSGPDHVNTFTAVAEDNDGTEATDDDDATVTFTDIAPVVDLVKTVDTNSLPEPGGVFNFTLTINNIGTVPFTITTLTDTNLTVPYPAEVAALIGQTVQPGGSVAATYPITHTAIGSYDNTANVLVTDDDGSTDSDEDTQTVVVTLVPKPSLTIDKTVKNLTQAGPFDDLADLEEGETALFKVVVTNTGNIPLNNVMLHDDKVASGTPVTIEGVGPATFDSASKINLGTMAPGASLTITYEYVTTVADVDEIIVNTVTASTILGNEQVLSVMDDATISVTAIPLASFGITITKKVVNQTKGGTLAAMANGFVGDTFTYVTTITNIGDSLLSDVVLTDDKAQIGGLVIRNSDNAELNWANIGGIAGLAIGELQAGASISYTYRYTAVAADVDEVIINVATVNAVFKPESEYYEDVPLMKEAEATISIVGIPITGESNNSGTAVGLAMILAAIVALILRRRNRRNQMEL